MLKPLAEKIRNSLRWWWRFGLMISWFGIVFTFVVPRSTVLISDINQAIAIDIASIHFDYLGWEAEALRAKTAQTLFGQHAFMDEATRSNYVRDYLQGIARIQSLNAEINVIYTNPEIENPLEESESSRIERDVLRQDLSRRQSIVEAILEGQVAAVLVDEGFGTFGQLLPPIAMRFTQMPNLLVTSPRDEIRMEVSIAVDPLSIDERNSYENQIDSDYDVASIIVPLGGIALYPAMIDETASISRAVEVFAHEWLHHYLYFQPLGLSYFTADGFNEEARIINETTADYFGKEIAQLVLQRYYPDEPLPQLPTSESSESVQSTREPDSNSFDFGAEMHETRTTLDGLLAEGKVEDAETYLGERHRFFFDNGYRFRKLNQAFFAFYGGYQAGGGGAGVGGDDPIGATIIAIREQSDSIKDFVLTLQDVTSRDELLSLRSDNQIKD